VTGFYARGGFFSGRWPTLIGFFFILPKQGAVLRWNISQNTQSIAIAVFLLSPSRHQPVPFLLDSADLSPLNPPSPSFSFIVTTLTIVGVKLPGENILPHLGCENNARNSCRQPPIRSRFDCEDLLHMPFPLPHAPHLRSRRNFGIASAAIAPLPS
jgi:hypothetical protein